jgi:deoxyribodipyrimidine photo-lyase
MGSTEKAIVWFRQDLRLADNPALHAAAGKGASVIPVFIHDDSAGEWQPGAASRWWVEHSLAGLNASLDGALQVFAGDPCEIIPRLVRTSGAGAVFWNRCVEPGRVAADRHIKSELQADGISVRSSNGAWLYDPAEVSKPDGTPYRVYTPFARHVLAKRAPRSLLPCPPRLQLDATRYPGSGRPRPEPWPAGGDAPWIPGEDAAQERLDAFVATGLENYAVARDRPDIDGVSRLSAHLHFGEISPHQLRGRVLNAANIDPASRDKFISELLWREFSAHLLCHFPELPARNVQKKFDRFPWGEDRQLHDAWTAGQTGYPIVDAGMRELRDTGYMHNRVRMIAGSFLVKNLLQDWRSGARWFWENLVDADLANNSASWQWVAGCGADAAPYFRIFNPILQGSKFDSHGVYVRRHVPELAALPDKFIHQPWNAPADVLAEAGVRLGETYPAPIVDLSESRSRALDAYHSLTQRVD